MIFSSIPVALVRICNLARYHAAGAIDYESIFNIKSTKSKKSLTELLAHAHLALSDIEAICNENQLALLKFRYGFSDKFGDSVSLEILSKIAYPKNPDIGELMVLSWRDNTRVGVLISSSYGIEERTAQRSIKAANEVLEKLRLNFLNDLSLSIKMKLLKHGFSIKRRYPLFNSVVIKPNILLPTV